MERRASRARLVLANQNKGDFESTSGTSFTSLGVYNKDLCANFTDG